MFSRNFQSTSGLVLLVVLSASALYGCSGNGEKKSSQAAHDSGTFAPLSTQASEVLGTKPVAKNAAPGEPDRSWTIVIASASGPDADQMAGMALEKVRTVGGLPKAYMEHRGKATVVAYGRYDGAMSKDAQQDLERLHTMTVDGQTPFANAILSPPPFDTLPGSIPDYDLATAKQRFGKNAIYSLQVACYERADGSEPTAKDLADIRGAAEKAAVELRREGEEAFYYHGPRKSMVTVGIFGDKDLDVRTRKESFRLTEARKNHPLNLVNGQGYKVRVRGQTEATLQPSVVIAIP
jgi:hypothetical protein